MAGAIFGGGGSLDALTGVGDLGTAILAAVPAAAKESVAPFVPAIVDAIYRAFSIATSNTFLLGIVAAVVAAGLVLLLHEAPARATDPAPEAAGDVADQGDAIGVLIRLACRSVDRRSGTQRPIECRMSGDCTVELGTVAAALSGALSLAADPNA